MQSRYEILRYMVLFWFCRYASALHVSHPDLLNSGENDIGVPSWQKPNLVVDDPAPGRPIDFIAPEITDKEGEVSLHQNHLKSDDDTDTEDIGMIQDRHDTDAADTEDLGFVQHRHDTNAADMEDLGMVKHLHGAGETTNIILRPGIEDGRRIETEDHTSEFVGLISTALHDKEEVLHSITDHDSSAKADRDFTLDLDMLKEEDEKVKLDEEKQISAAIEAKEKESSEKRHDLQLQYDNLVDKETREEDGLEGRVEKEMANLQLKTEHLKNDEHALTEQVSEDKDMIASAKMREANDLAAAKASRSFELMKEGTNLLKEECRPTVSEEGDELTCRDASCDETGAKPKRNDTAAPLKSDADVSENKARLAGVPLCIDDD